MLRRSELERTGKDLVQTFRPLISRNFLLIPVQNFLENIVFVSNFLPIDRLNNFGYETFSRDPDSSTYTRLPT